MKLVDHYTQYTSKRYKTIKIEIYIDMVSILNNFYKLAKNTAKYQ